MIEFRSEFLETEEVCVKTATAYLVTTGFGYHCFTHPGKQWTDHKYTAAQLCTLMHKLIALQIFKVELICLEGIGVLSLLTSHFFSLNLHTDILQQLDEIVYIADIRDVMYRHFLIGKQSSTDYLQGLVFCSLRGNLTTKRSAAFYDK